MPYNWEANAHAGTVFIVSNHSGHACDVQGGAIKPGTNIIGWPKKPLHEAGNQRWVFTPDSYIHLAGHPELVLDCRGGPNHGTDVILYNKKPIHEADNQRWKFNKKGQLRLKANKNLVLDVKGGSKAAGHQLILWDKKKHDYANQQFHLQH
eukprot:TRINITY_DN100_c0_g1_i1.p1 TRINITY_DN100_c0_g1~~TRINITY_DN100_c0_g1_i1.p1  ORF type:complete len:151 (-),score=29.66 TRINITY_DN100_c0_g1_i1:73-525(-)